MAMKRSKVDGKSAFLAATAQVAWKELKTSFRDRQTTLYTLVLPIVLYPFLFWSMIQASLFLEGRSEVTEVTVGIAAEDASIVPPGLAEALGRDPRSNRSVSDAQRVGSGIDLVHTLPMRSDLDELAARSWITGRSAGIRDPGPRPDAVVYFAADESGQRESVRILYDSTRTDSEIANARLRRRIPAYARELREEAAAEADPAGGSLEPFVREPVQNVAPRPAIGAYILSTVLPVLFVIITVMGAFFPAVDLTCGERERKTAETTMLLPVPRSAIHLGKILAVCAAALIATSLNITALALSAEHLLRMLPNTGSIEVQVPVRAMLQAAPLLLLFAFFVSSVLTGLSGLARTFKDGQALLGPVQILFIMPGLAGALPGVELTPFLASVPVVNVVLCFRSLLRSEFHLLEYAVTAVSLTALSLAAILISLWMQSRETLVLGESGSTWDTIRGLLRSSKGVR
jgi:ABC-type Na+ efflux pump permease subunit